MATKAKKVVTVPKKGKDGLPFDALGNFLSIGSIVVIAASGQKLGFIKKLFKNGKALVRIYYSLGDSEDITLDSVHHQAVAVKAEDLNITVSLFEKVKFDAKTFEMNN